MIIGWTHPRTGRFISLENTEIDHIIPMAVLGELHTNDANDKRHSGPNLTVTAGTGCARSLGISRAIPCHPNPERLWRMQVGTWFHTWMAENTRNDPDWYNEDDHRDKCEVKGYVRLPDGKDAFLSGLMDKRRKDWGIAEATVGVDDWKFSVGKADQYVDKTGEASALHKVQMNMLRNLAEQTFNIDLSELQMRVRVIGASWRPTWVPYMTVEECMETQFPITSGMRDRKTKEVIIEPPTYGEMMVKANNFFIRWKEVAKDQGCDVFELDVEVRKELVREMLPERYGERMWVTYKGDPGCKLCPWEVDCNLIDGGL